MAIDRKMTFFGSLKMVLIIILILWGILVLCTFLPFLRELGIRPRSLIGLVGIITSPFLHANLAHLIANSISFIVLGTMLLITEGMQRFWLLFVSLMLWGGLGTWLIGRGGTNHIGASGVIYGIMGYLFFKGVFRRDLKTILMSVAVFFLYGGAILGAMFGWIGTDNAFISWEGHLCGLIAGMVIAKTYPA